MAEHEEERLEQLQRLVPALFAVPGTVLYIGAGRRAQCAQALVDAGHTLTLLEVHPPNAAMHIRPGSLFAEVVCGDVRDLDLVCELYHFDIVFWWHGPEHIPAYDLKDTLQALEEIAGCMVILGSPWGINPQEALDGNPHEQHLNALYPEHYEALGYSTATLGTRDVPGSHILAWKEL